MVQSPGRIYFGAALTLCAEINDMTMAEVCKKAHINPTNVSKWKKGRYQVIPEKMLLRIVSAVAKDQKQADELFAAYVIDMMPGDSRRRLNVAPVVETPEGTDPRGLAGAWGTEVRMKLHRIGDAADKDAEFRRMFDTLSGWAKRITGNSGD